MQSSIQNITSHHLYNMLQDYRHILVIDLRQPHQYTQLHIRDSFNLVAETQDKVSCVIEVSVKKAEEREIKYSNLKKIRRYLFIDSTPFQDIGSDKMKIVKKVLKQIPKDQNSKVYGLIESYQTFHQIYPFISFNKSQIQKISAQQLDQKQLRNQIDRALIYPYCKFPSSIIPGQLYLGSVYSSNSEKQLKDLGIRNLVDFIDYSKQQLIPNFKQNYNLLSFPYNEKATIAIDFDSINSEILEEMQQGPTLLYCRDGESVSAAMAISFLMYKNNINATMATLKICQAIGRSDINKAIYTQLLGYKPKK